MDREVIEPEVSGDERTVRLAFPEPAPAGRFFRLELYGVVFPAEGGQMQCEGACLLADGSKVEAAGIPAISVTGVSALDRFEASLASQPWVEAWNSNTFLRLFLNPVLVVSSLPIIFSGFLMALAIVLVAFPVAIPFGFCFALMRISKSRILRALAGIYVNLIRGTPAFSADLHRVLRTAPGGHQHRQLPSRCDRDGDELGRLPVRDLPAPASSPSPRARPRPPAPWA